MDCNSQRNSEAFQSRSRSDAQHGLEQHPCVECRTLCRSMHGPVKQECPLKGCYICADLANTDIEISRTYKRLRNLVKKRQRIFAEPNHKTIIHRLPVEILSLIFVFVKDEINDFIFRELPSYVLFQPPSKQPSQSPPLLVGAVCKRWKDITLAMPELWTQITINLDKSVDGQITMVKEWASRSDALPIDITAYTKWFKWENKIGRCGDILSSLRLLSTRWHDISLDAPASFCSQLLNNLQRTPLINSVFLTLQFGELEPIQLQHPFLPRRLMINSFNHSGTIHLPFEWDRLVFFEATGADIGHSLHVIRYAQNLRHCITEPDFECPGFLIPTSPITHHSLVYLVTNSHIIKHLTLPSLQHLDVATSEGLALDESLDSIVKFVNRSCPPLEDFILCCNVDYLDPFPQFDNLRGVTSLILVVEGKPDHPNIPLVDNFLLTLTQHSPDMILPRLKEIALTINCMLASSWSSFSHLFEQHTPSNPTDIKTISNTPIPSRRSLSQGRVCLMGDLEVTMDKDTFLRLLQAENLGVDLSIVDLTDRDLFDSIAEFHKIEL